MALGSRTSSYLTFRSRTFSYLVLCSVMLVVSSSRSRCSSVLFFSSERLSASEGNGNIHSQSLSPWTWRSTTVENRIPSTIWEAECSTSYCSDLNPGQAAGPRHNAVPIYQHILVLHRHGREACHTASYLSVAVGCTCVWAKTS